VKNKTHILFNIWLNTFLKGKNLKLKTKKYK